MTTGITVSLIFLVCLPFKELPTLRAFLHSGGSMDGAFGLKKAAGINEFLLL